MASHSITSGITVLSCFHACVLCLKSHTGKMYNLNRCEANLISFLLVSHPFFFLSFIIAVVVFESHSVFTRLGLAGSADHL